MAVIFRTSRGAVRGMTEILQQTRKSTSGCLQPFRLVALDDEDHTRLRRAMELQLDKAIIEVSGGRAAAATMRAELFNLQFERPPILRTWSSDTDMLHRPDMLYARTCYRCTCHPRERP